VSSALPGLRQGLRANLRARPAASGCSKPAVCCLPKKVLVNVEVNFPLHPRRSPSVTAPAPLVF